MKKLLTIVGFTAAIAFASQALAAPTDVCARLPNHPLCNGGLDDDGGPSSWAAARAAAKASASANGGNANVIGSGNSAQQQSQTSTQNTTVNQTYRAARGAATAPSISVDACVFSLSAGNGFGAGGIGIPLQYCKVVAEANMLVALGRPDIAIEHMATIPRVSRTYKRINER